MVRGKDHCDHTWKYGYPYPCKFLPTGFNAPSVNQIAAKTGEHNVLYLVDEHAITNKYDESVQRVLEKGAKNATTLRRRLIFYHDKVNLDIMNVGEIPTTITLPPRVADPIKFPVFKWEGYMFDIPTSTAAVRVGIVAGAALAHNEALNGHGGDAKAPTQADRPIGFTGSYADAGIPFGPIIQVRRDDQYRVLGGGVDPDGKKVAWRLAYYITKETPKSYSAPLPKHSAALEDKSTNPDTAPESEDPLVVEYDLLLDNNLPEDLSGDPDDESVAPWGGNLFSSLNAAELIPLGDEGSGGGAE